MNREKFKRMFPGVSSGPYDLGKHWPETGDYQKWRASRIEDFKKHYHYFDHETFSTNTGGVILYAYGLPQDQFDGLMAGTRCPEYPCLGHKEIGKPDDVAIHLVDRHQWDAEKARLWLRDKVEEGAFNDPV